MTALFTLLPEAVGTEKLDGKSAVLERLADRFAAVYGLDAAAVLAALNEREALGSTGFGRGVAIPHARIAGVEHPVAVFLRLEAPVGLKRPTICRWIWCSACSAPNWRAWCICTRWPPFRA
jgi:PTS system nitrogen regulatory IIA component